MILSQKLYLEALEHILSTNKHCDADFIMAGFADYFYKKMVTDSDKKILGLAFDSQLNQSMIDSFLKTWDIEVAGSTKALLLAYVMKLHPELKFDSYTEPRLKGLLRFFRFQNLELISHYTKIVSALNQQGIIPMILKGGAMKYLRPDFPRVMGDIDILVRTKKEYLLAQKIVQKMGYEIEDNTHSVDLHLPNSKVGILDIHRYVDLGSPFEKNFSTGLFSRAQKKKVFATDTLVPCIEDMLFICLVNMVKNLREKTSVNGILYNLFDLEFFQKNSINWKIVQQNIIDTHTIPQVYVAYKFVEKISPKLLPKLLIQNKKLQKEIITYCNRDIFYLLYVYPIKCIGKTLHLKNEVKSWKKFRYYLKIKIKKGLVKYILKHPVLVAYFLKICYKR